MHNTVIKYTLHRNSWFKFQIGRLPVSLGIILAILVTVCSTDAQILFTPLKMPLETQWSERGWWDGIQFPRGTARPIKAGKPNSSQWEMTEHYATK